MFFQKNLITGETPEYSQALQEVTVQDLQNTPAESGKKNWIILIVLAIVAFIISPKESTKGKYKQTFKRR